MSGKLKAVSLPKTMQQKIDTEFKIRGEQASPKTQRFQSYENMDPLRDSQYVRRLKKANYGRWYIKPE
jgi:hypothetical protein